MAIQHLYPPGTACIYTTYKAQIQVYIETTCIINIPNNFENIPIIKIKEANEYQLRLREQTRNIQILSNRHKSTNNDQENRSKTAVSRPIFKVC